MLRIAAKCNSTFAQVKLGCRLLQAAAELAKLLLSALRFEISGGISTSTFQRWFVNNDLGHHSAKRGKCVSVPCDNVRSTWFKVFDLN